MAIFVLTRRFIAGDSSKFLAALLAGAFLLPGLAACSAKSSTGAVLPHTGDLRKKAALRLPLLSAWSWANPLPQGNALLDAAYGNGMYVAVGEAGTIVTSPDGNAWSAHYLYPANGPKTAATTLLDAVTFANGTFVAVGMKGLIARSSTGTNWKIGKAPVGSRLTSIAYGNGLFVAVSTNGKAVFSSDGIRWTAASISTGVNFQAIAYGNGTFAAFGGSGGVIYTSSDAVHWTQTASITGNFGEATFANGEFMSVAYNGNGPAFYTSPDGITWTATAFPASFSAFGISFGNGEFVASGWTSVGNASESAIATSTDGQNWSVTSYPSGTFPVTYTRFLNGQFVAPGAGGFIALSEDGTTWSAKTSALALTGGLSNVTFGNGAFVAVGGDASGSGLIMSSPDGVTWTQEQSNTGSSLTGATFTGSEFVAVGYKGVVVTSNDGVTWTLRHSGGADLYSVVAGPNRVVATGKYEVLVSSDGGMFTPYATKASIVGVTYGDNEFLGVGGKNVFTSADGATWTSRAVSNNTLASAANGNGTFVAVGRAGTILSSSDGVTWTAQPSQTANNLQNVAYSGGEFIAVGAYGIVLSSPDGATWTPMAIPPYGGTLNGVVESSSYGALVGRGTGAGAIFHI